MAFPPFPLSLFPPPKGEREGGRRSLSNTATMLSLSLSPPVAKEGSTGEGHTHIPLLKNKKRDNFGI